MSNTLFLQRPYILYLLLGLTGCLYFIFGYHTTRAEFSQVISLYATLFVVYLLAYHYFALAFFKQLLFAGILFRLLLLFSVPNLSEDVYRFIWDGRVSSNGINPFAFLPSEIRGMPNLTGLSPELYAKLNSPNYYSVYPPVLQGIFWMTAKVFPENIFASIVFMKTIIVMVEAGTIALLIKILRKLSTPKEASLLYVLNPMVITELTGNAHFDGLVIFFVLLAFFLVLHNKWKSSAFFLGAGIVTKLIPVLFLPLLIHKLGWRKGIVYGMITLLTCMVFLLFVFDRSTLQHMITSADLFIKTFEFNASIYYLVRWTGTLIKGYNTIAIIGPLLYLISASLILFISWFNDERSNTSFLNKALFIISLWYLCATTVHPWYVSLAVALSVLTTFRYAIIWSFTSLLSYAAYQYVPVKENLWLIGAGYILVLSFACWELTKTWKNKLPET